MGIFSIFSKKSNDHDVATQNSTEKVENKEHSTLDSPSPLPEVSSSFIRSS